MHSMNSVQDLMVQTLGDLHAAERRQLDALPTLIQGARAPELREALRQHEQETRTHVQRLEQIFQQLGRPLQEVADPVLDAMVRRGTELLAAAAGPEVKEAALIAEARKFEHLEIAGYGTAAAIARQVGNAEVAGLLAQTLREEAQSDERLGRIAEAGGIRSVALQQQQQQQRQVPTS
ncbi:MAG: hypothetical protein JWO31_3626 [Phycisphaerales bacterium]|nr:hypothetical protein [Phycisphaerales bacterium]